VGVCELGVERSCTDNFDNDLDNSDASGWSGDNDGYRTYGNWDCADYDCASIVDGSGQFGNGTHTFACPINEYSGGLTGGAGHNQNASWCFDGIDNDLDGSSDCSDSDCTGVTNPVNNQTCLTDEFNGTEYNNSVSGMYCADSTDNDRDQHSSNSRQIVIVMRCCVIGADMCVV